MKKIAFFLSIFVLVLFAQACRDADELTPTNSTVSLKEDVSVFMEQQIAANSAHKYERLKQYLESKGLVVMTEDHSVEEKELARRNGLGFTTTCSHTWFAQPDGGQMAVSECTHTMYDGSTINCILNSYYSAEGGPAAVMSWCDND